MSRVLLFGKLPAHGDFVSRGLAPADRDALDNWLSSSLADARNAVGGAFEPQYDSAPPWRCMITVGGAPVAGALAASQDAAGRRYPLLLAVRDGGEAAAEACEALLYDAIAGGWDADTLVEHAETVTDDAAQPPSPRFWTLGGESFDPAMIVEDRPPTLIATMLRQAETVS